MKRILCALFVMLMLIPCAFADEIDLSGMSVDELKALRDRIDAELLSRTAPEEGMMIIDNEYYRVVYLGYTIEDDKYHKDSKLVTVTVEWTNKASSARALNWGLDFRAYADGIGIYADTFGLRTEIRPNITAQAGAAISVKNGTAQLEVDFTMWGGYNTIKTITIDMR